MHLLAERKSLFREYVQTIELNPSDRPGLDLASHGILPQEWPPSSNEEDQILDKGTRAIYIEDPQHADYKLFRESRKRFGHKEADLANLTTVWPAFTTALSNYSSEQEVTDAFDYPDSGMILLALSSPNLEKLIIHDRTGQFIIAFDGIFRTVGNAPVSTTIGDTEHSKYQQEKADSVSKFLPNLQILHITHGHGYFPLRLLAPVLSFVPLQELIRDEASDLWTHGEFPCMRFDGFKWLTPNPLMTISKLAI